MLNKTTKAFREICSDILSNLTKEYFIFGVGEFFSHYDFVLPTLRKKESAPNVPDES